MEKLGVTETEKVGLDLKLFQKGLNFTPVYTLNMLFLLNTNFKVCKRIFIDFGNVLSKAKVDSLPVKTLTVK